jgi:hypothetical protein
MLSSKDPSNSYRDSGDRNREMLVKSNFERERENTSKLMRFIAKGLS